MSFRVHEDTGQSIVFRNEKGDFQFDLHRDDRWRTTFRLLALNPATNKLEVRGISVLVGGKEPYTKARSLLIEAVEEDKVSEQNEQELSHSIFAKIRAGSELRNRTFAHQDMHHGQITAFLERLIQDEPNTPSEVRDRLGRYQLTAEAFETNTSFSFMLADLDFEGDWVYSMAIDLVERQHAPGDAFCFIVAAESADAEFVSGFMLFRELLDSISGGYVHFFALSDLNGGPSSTGKHALAAELRNAGINVRADEAFLVAIRLREIKDKHDHVHYDADVMGTISFAGKISDEDVKPLLMQIVESARKAKLDGESFEVFQAKLTKEIAWLRASQRIPLLVALVSKLKTAMTFLHP